MVIDFNKMPCIYWDDITKCNYLQRQIIIHSIIYYELNDNVISDKDFDTICKQLIKIQKGMLENEYKKTEYYYVFKEFTGETGFYLYGKLNKKDKEYLLNIARRVILLKKGKIKWIV